MQLEDKLVEDRDAAHAESQQREDIEERGDETLPAPVVEALHNAAIEQRGALLGAMRMILDRQPLEVSQLRLPQRESLALDALQVAVTGKSSDLYQFVYAEDRRDLLERALGVLQPDLIHANDQSAHELHAQFADLSERVAELRHELTELEDAQDELQEHQQKAALEADQPGDKPPPRPPAKPSDPDAPRPPTTLTGPELPEQPPAPTTLTGPERPEPKPVATTLTGPERPEPKPVATTLTGPERPEPKPVATTLTGPELPEIAPAPSTLGGDGDAAPADDAKAKRPWWRRPFG